MLGDVFVHDTYLRIGGVQVWPPSSLAVALVIVFIAALAGGAFATAKFRPQR